MGPRFSPPSSQGSPRPSSPPLDKPALSGLLLVRSPLTVLPLLFRQLAMDPVCPVLVRTASPGQGAAPLTRATLSALSSALPWLDPTGGFLRAAGPSLGHLGDSRVLGLPGVTLVDSSEFLDSPASAFRLQR